MLIYEPIIITFTRLRNISNAQMVNHTHCIYKRKKKKKTESDRYDRGFIQLNSF